MGSESTKAQESRYNNVCADRPAIDNDTLYFCGTLDDAFVAFLSRSVSPNISKLIITSYGGQFDATKEAFEIVENSKLKVVVEGVCASACAHFLFIPASRGEVLPGAILALHTSSTSQRVMRLRSEWQEYERLKPLMDVAAEKERAFYIEHGLDPRLLLEPTLVMRPACVSEKIDWSDPLTPKMDYLSESLWWTPRQAELERFGMKSKDGFWVETLSDLQLLAASNKKFRLGMITAVSPSGSLMTEKALGQIPKCETLGK